MNQKKTVKIQINQSNSNNRREFVSNSNIKPDIYKNKKHKNFIDTYT